ncbi:MAG: signal peptidase I [Solirubrobacterales bacterium]|nr:signal peptidase I [Solirubrobacterales bacterium]
MTKRKNSLAGSLAELVLITATAVGLALVIQAVLVKPYRIPSGSMLPTLHINQRVLVNRFSNNFSKPSLGDILVFHPPSDYADGCKNPSQGENQDGQDSAKACDVAQSRPSSETFIKRVVGLPGDHISIARGHVLRNGIAEHEPYILPCGGDSSCNFPGIITVPRGDYFMMGDNRPDSEDSRFWGPVPRGWIIGKAFLTYWPPDRVGFL